MPNILQTTVGYYDLNRSLEDCGEIKVRTFEPSEIIKARAKDTRELIDIEGDKFQPHEHSIFIDGREFNVVNRTSKFLGRSEDGLEAPEGQEEDSDPKVKGKHPSKKPKVSKTSKEDKCG